MAKPEKGAFAHLAVTGAELTVRVVPGARQAGVEEDAEGLKIRVTAAPEGGKANAAVREALARSLGVAKGRLALIRGETARVKTWRID